MPHKPPHGVLVGEATGTTGVVVVLHNLGLEEPSIGVVFLPGQTFEQVPSDGPHRTLPPLCDTHKVVYPGAVQPLPATSRNRGLGSVVVVFPPPFLTLRSQKLFRIVEHVLGDKLRGSEVGVRWFEAFRCRRGGGSVVVSFEDQRQGRFVVF